MVRRLRVAAYDGCFYPAGTTICNYYPCKLWRERNDWLIDSESGMGCQEIWAILGM